MLKFNGFCQLLDKEIHEGTCIEIISELYGGKKEEEIQLIKKEKKITDDLIERICTLCPNYPD